jgi:hypothetical protein
MSVVYDNVVYDNKLMKVFTALKDQQHLLEQLAFISWNFQDPGCGSVSHSRILQYETGRSVFQSYSFRVRSIVLLRRRMCSLP